MGHRVRAALILAAFTVLGVVAGWVTFDRLPPGTDQVTAAALSALIHVVFAGIPVLLADNCIRKSARRADHAPEPRSGSGWCHWVVAPYVWVLASPWLSTGLYRLLVLRDDAAGYTEIIFALLIYSAKPVLRALDWVWLKTLKPDKAFEGEREQS